MFTVLTARRYPRDPEALGEYIQCPNLPTLMRQFLYDQINSDTNDSAMAVPLASCPPAPARVLTYTSAIATFHAPSDHSGIGGMRRERIRAVPSWRNDPAGRYDCVYVTKDENANGFRGLSVARVRAFLSFQHAGINYPCALIEWFVPTALDPDPDTGMWVVEPEFNADGSRPTQLIHVDSILRNAHLIPVFGDDSVSLPPDFKASSSLNEFAAFFVNKFADHSTLR